jgi:hypothetical protein
VVESRLIECDAGTLRIGQPMELRIVPYTVRPDGVEVLTFAFAPTSTSTDEEN